MATKPSLVDPVTILSLFAVLAILFAAFGLAHAVLPSKASRKDRFTFVWLAFDALIHFIFEGSFLFLSFPVPRTVNTATPSPFKTLWLEYAQADLRWGTADITVVSLEFLTVLGAGPLCCYILWLLKKDDRARHYWLVVLSTAEIYGGWMTFAPEWFTGNHNLNVADSWIHLWIYLFLMNMIWVVIPLWLMWDSFGYIAKALRDPVGFAALVKKEEAGGKVAKKRK
ncbi:Emopamil-binding protein [Meredithblackwellia eburnea MCA 4105]